MNLISLPDQTATQPVPMSVALGATVARLRRSLAQVDPGVYSISPRSAPSSDERLAMEARLENVDRWLRPAGPDAARREIASVLGTMGLRAGSETDVKVILEIYVSDLCNLPLFALTSACKAARTGELGDGVWAPTSAQLNRHAVASIDWLHRDTAELRLVLNAKIEEQRRPDEGAAARVERILAETKASLAMAKLHEYRGGAPVKAEPPETPEQALARIQAKAGEPLPQLSDEARAKLGIRPSAAA